MNSRRLLQRVLDAIAPCHCSLCGLPSGRSVELCVHCEGELPWLTHSCRRCALPLAAPAPLCGRCLSSPPAFDRCLAACAYVPPITGWVHAAKYQGDFASLGLLAYLLRRAVTAHREPAPDLLLPMPLHWWRRRRRGFNQAQELARMLTRHPALADLALAPGLARRTRATASQRQLDARERQRNLRGAFRVEPAVAGKTVAIVDDVLTTGASADALARALKAAGAATVSVWCCARTPEPG